MVTGGATGLLVACPTLTCGNVLTGNTEALTTSGADCLSVNDVTVNAP